MKNIIYLKKLHQYIVLNLFFLICNIVLTPSPFLHGYNYQREDYYFDEIKEEYKDDYKEHYKEDYQDENEYSFDNYRLSYEELDNPGINTQSLNNFKSSDYTIEKEISNSTVSSKNNVLVKRKGELMIPANGDCLFTSILLGYLLPVLNNREKFNKRCFNALEEKEVKNNANILWEELKSASSSNYFRKIQSCFFKKIIKSFRANMAISSNIWGGLQEIQILSDKLAITIEEYIPDPINNEKLTNPRVTKPKHGNIIAVIGIIQDIAYPEEQSYDQNESIRYQEAVNNSNRQQVYPQHFRLKIENHLTNQVATEEEWNIPLFNISQNTIEFYIEALKNEDFLLENQNQSKEFSFFSKNQKLAIDEVEEGKLYTQMPDSLEKSLAILANRLRKLVSANFCKSPPKQNKQNKKFATYHQEPSIRDFSTSIQRSSHQGESETLLALCSEVERYGKKYIQSNDLLTQLNIRVKKIRNSIDTKEFRTASKQAALLMREIEPVSIRKTLFYAYKAEETSRIIEGKHIVLLIGPTGVGKSTTLLYLMGCKMQEIKKDNVTHIEAIKNSIPEKYQKQIANITSSPLPRSETRYITSITVKIKDFCIRGSKIKEVVFCDTPGFEDTNGPEIDIANGARLIEVIKHAKGVRIALILSTASLDEERMQPLTKIFNLTTKLLPSFYDHIGTFTYLFTKANSKEDKDEIHHKIKNLLNSAKNNDIPPIDRYTKLALKDILEKTQNGAWIVDPTQSLDRTPTAKQIMKNLVSSQDYIENPSKVFHNFLGEKSKTKLMQQLHYHQSTIKLALANQNFLLVSYKLEEIRLMKELLRISEIDYTYTDIMNFTKSKWNDMAKGSMQKFEKELLSPLPLNGSMMKMITEYIKTYHLYFSFDKPLRAKHFPDGIKGESLIQNIKAVLVKLRMKVLYHSFTEIKKTKVYLAKLKVLSEKIKSCVPFIKKTHQLLRETIKKDQEKIEQLLLKKEFWEVVHILNRIEKAKILKKELDSNVFNIELHHKMMKHAVLNMLTNTLKQTYQILGKEYQQKKQAIPPSPHCFTLFNLNRVNKLKVLYNIIVKAKYAFQNSDSLSDIAKEVEILYQDYINQNVDFIQKCTEHIIELTKLNQKSSAKKANQLIKCILTLREVAHEVQAATYHEERLIQECMNSHIQEKKDDISSLIGQFSSDVHDEKKSMIESLVKHINIIRKSTLLSSKEKNNKLQKVEDAFVVILKNIIRKVRFLNLSLNDLDNFKQVDKFMNTLTMIKEAKAGDFFKAFNKYEKQFLETITQKVMTVVRDVEQDFKETKITLNDQKQLLELLKDQQKYFNQSQKLEKTFTLQLSQLPENIVDLKTLEKVTNDLHEELKSMEVRVKKLLDNLQNNKKELAYLKALIKVREDYDLTESEEIVRLNKIIKGKSNGRVKSIREAINFKKKELTIQQKLRAEEKNNKEQLYLLKEKVNMYDRIHADYRDKKKEIEKNLKESFEKLSKTFLRKEEVEKLREGQVEYLDSYIKKLEHKIDLYIKKSNSYSWKKIDIDRLLAEKDYLQEAMRIEWVNRKTDGNLEYDNYNISAILERNFTSIKKYLRSYMMMTKKSMLHFLNDLNSLVNQSHQIDDDNSNNKLVDYHNPRILDTLYILFKELYNWEKHYKEKLFTPYIGYHFIEECKEKILEITSQLEYNYIIILRKKSLKEIIIQSEIVRKISRLDYLIDEKEKRATHLYTQYQQTISQQVSDKEIKECIEKRNYTFVNKKLTKLLEQSETIQDIDYDMTQNIESIRMKLYSSMMEVIERVSTIFLNVELNSEEQLANSQVLELSKLAKKISTAQRIFFKDNSSNSFLRAYQDELEEELNQIKEKVNNWMNYTKETIKSSINLHQFVKAEKLLSYYKKIQIALKKSVLLGHEYQNSKVAQEMEKRLSDLKEKYYTKPSNNMMKGSSELNYIYSQGKEIFNNTQQNYQYTPYLKNIEEKHDTSITKQNQDIKVLFIPEQPRNNPQNLYNSKSRKPESKINKKLQEISSTHTVNEQIKVWNKYKNDTSCTEREREEIIEKIHRSSQAIKSHFDGSLLNNKLQEASRDLEELKKYKVGLSSIYFLYIHKLYDQAHEQALSHGNNMIEDINTDRIEKSPQALHLIIAQLKQLKAYSKLFLKK